MRLGESCPQRRGGARKMRNSRLLLCSLAAIAFANPVWAQGQSKIAAAPSSGLPDDADVEVVPYVNVGDQIGIACTALTKSNPQSDVRVVLTISAQPGDTPARLQQGSRDRRTSGAWRRARAHPDRARSRRPSRQCRRLCRGRSKRAKLQRRPHENCAPAGRRRTRYCGLKFSSMTLTQPRRVPRRSRPFARRARHPRPCR